MRHSAKKSTCDTQLFSRSHPRTPRGGWCEHWRALWGSFGAVSVGYAPTPFHGNPREGKGVKHRDTRIRHLWGRVEQERPNPLKNLKSAGCSLPIGTK